MGVRGGDALDSKVTICPSNPEKLVFICEKAFVPKNLSTSHKRSIWSLNWGPFLFAV